MKTFSQIKRDIKEARELITFWRQEIRHTARGKSFANYPKGLNLPRHEFDVMQWGVASLGKAWIPELDTNGEIIPGSPRLLRIHQGFCKNDGTENFMFLGLAVRCQEPYGLVL